MVAMTTWFIFSHSDKLLRFQCIDIDIINIICVITLSYGKIWEIFKGNGINTLFSSLSGCILAAVVDEAAEVATCSCPWSAEEFSQLQSDVSSLKVEMEDMKKRLEDEEPSNEIPAPEGDKIVTLLKR